MGAKAMALAMCLVAATVATAARPMESGQALYAPDPLAFHMKDNCKSTSCKNFHIHLAVLHHTLATIVAKSSHRCCST